MPSPRLPFRTVSTDAAPIPDEEDHEADLPLTMTASVVLTSLPRDAHAALAAAGAFEKEKSNIIPPLVPLCPVSLSSILFSRSYYSKRLLTYIRFGSYSTL